MPNFRFSRAQSWGEVFRDVRKRQRAAPPFFFCIAVRTTVPQLSWKFYVQVNEGQVTTLGQVTPPPKKNPNASRTQWWRERYEVFRIWYTTKQGCDLWRNCFKLPPFCTQPVAALEGCQQRPERWRTEVLDFCTGSHKSSSFSPRKSRTSNNPVPVLHIPSKYGWMSCSLNESNLNHLRHKLQPC